MLRTAFLLAFAIGSIPAQTPDPAYQPLDRAYKALRAKNYDQAIAGFEQAIALAPTRPAIRKDLAYTLLKVGENEAARDQFGEAMRLDPTDEHVALEYAFLCYETKQQAEARRIFDRIRKTGQPPMRETAEQAFQNIDQPLAAGIARWLKALEVSPDNFSAHQELAELAEQRDELSLAAEHYEKAWKLRPGERSLMLDLGRVWKALGRTEEANYILLAASRGGQPRVAERARELLPARYPYVYEFEKALEIDPKNFELRREYAYLLLAMGKKDEAERQFQLLHETAPNDLLTSAQLGFLRLNRKDYAGAQPLLDQVLKGDDDELADRVREALKLPRTLRDRNSSAQQKSEEAKELAEKSMRAGYMKDALKYLTIAHENDPVDFSVMLNLGRVYNILHDDKDAIKWFDLASKSPDSSVSDPASEAYHNLAPEFALFRTTMWVYPFFSSRWHDAFGYAQLKTELKLGKFPIHPYVSVRLDGDVRGNIGPTAGTINPQYLSESSFIFALGAATSPWHGVTGWFEAGEAVKYLPSRTDVGSMIPDYRGGLSYGKGFGHLMNSSKGLYFESNDDGVFVSRFQDDMLLYSQNRGGYTFSSMEGFGGLQAQLYWNTNFTADSLHQYWANFAEAGPGLRWRFRALPKSVLFSVNFLRGVYTVNEGNPRRPNYFDFRAGLWYAFTR
ncbi:MAG TPA: tetratricopeptide repeat protein [Bryobacteraceae bacterium]|nr:tetratricopeptide repeat protein [Bryobacteraceae bacterium]